MKKLISVILSVMLVVCMAASCANAEEQLAGGWYKDADTTVTEDARQAFDKAMQGFAGASYEPVALLGTQVVAGLNYCYLCKGTLVTAQPQEFWAMVFVYLDLEGNATVTGIEEIRPDMRIQDEYEAEYEEGYVEDGQNPVMNLIGWYQDETSQRAMMFIEAGAGNTAVVRISWANSASETVEWEMSGELDTDTLTIAYTNAVMKNCVYDENGNCTAETVYENGTGRFTIREDGAILWQDDAENAGADCVFIWADMK